MTRTLTATEIREAYRICAHAAARVEQDELGPSQGRVNVAPGIRVLPTWLQKNRKAIDRTTSRTLAGTRGGGSDGDAA